MADRPQLSDAEKPIVLIYRIPSFKASFLSFLSAQFHLLDSLDQPAVVSDHARSIRALVSLGPSPVTSETLDLYPCLELVVGSSAGVDHIDLQECRRRGIAVTNAENRRLTLIVILLSHLGGKRARILGLGSIGSGVAKRLVPFNCNIAYNSRNKKPSIPYTFYPNVIYLAHNCDILVVCCALSEEIRHIINKDVMTALGKEGVIINVGRGDLVDENELVQFLNCGELGGAGLDVFEKEPNVPKELLAMDNVVLSPHSAVLTPESFETVHGVVLGNLKAFFSIRSLISPV